MATLTINGQQVKIDDAFLSLPPEQQSATVDEIAKTLTASAPAEVTDASLAQQTGQRQQAFWNQRPAVPKIAGPDLMGSIASTIGGGINGIPVIGPLAQSASDNLMGIGSQLTGGDYGQTVKGLQERRAQIAEANPIANVAGNIGGAIGSLGLGATTAVGQNALGMTGSTLNRMFNSALSTQGLSMADSMARGQTPMDSLTSNILPSAIAGSLPLIGAGIKAGTSAVVDKSRNAIRSVMDPAGEASRRVGVAQQAERAATGMTTPIGLAEQQAAQRAGVDLINADLGGERTRALARAIANQSPESRGALENIVTDRFKGQTEQVENVLSRLNGGKVDDLAYQQAILDAAKQANRPAYQRAYNDPKAASVFTVETQELMQSPTVQKAISDVSKTSADEAALYGTMPVENPFRQAADGTWKLVQKANGTLAVPSLEFWDHVQRNLRGMAGTARRAGDDDASRRVDNLRKKLLATLDARVPDFKTARQGAYEFFQAEDALEAGRNAFKTPKQMLETKQAFTKFTAPDKEAFRTGVLSEALRTAKSIGDSRDVAKRLWEAPARRELFELALGKNAYQELESFLKVQTVANQLRNAVQGNSTTTRQLVEMGLARGTPGAGGAGVGFAMSGGNPIGAIIGGLAGEGLRRGQTAVEQRVMQEMAQLLLSGDKALMDQAVANAVVSQEWRKALDTLSEALAVGAKGAVVGTMVGGTQ